MTALGHAAGPSISAPTRRAPSRGPSVVLLVAAATGLLASLALSVEKYRVLSNPGYLPACTVSEVVNCGSVMQSWQSTVLGFPNAIVGVAGYSVVVTVAVMALAGASPARWVWFGLLAGAGLGTVFVHWLAWQTAYDIGALCVYCIAVWVSTITILGCAGALLLAGAGQDAAGPVRGSAVVGWVPVGLIVWLTLLAVFVAFGLTARS